MKNPNRMKFPQLILVFSFCACLSAVTLAAPDEGPIGGLVTDPGEREFAGFDADATNVYTDGEGGYFQLFSEDELADPATKQKATPKTLFGNVSTSFTSVGPYEFNPRSEDQLFVRNLSATTIQCNSPETEEEFIGQVHLPSGALIIGFHYHGRDVDSGSLNRNNAQLRRVCQNTTANPSVSSISARVGTTGNEAPGNFFATNNVIGHTVDNNMCHYFVEINLGDSDCQSSSIQAYKARILWRRQISPAPAVASFNDVPTSHPFFREIEALAASGITQGCLGGGSFCPGRQVTRQEMAAFLARALGLHWAGN